MAQRSVTATEREAGKIHCATAASLVDFVRETWPQIDMDALLRRHRIALHDRSSWFDAHVPDTQIFALLADVARATDDPAVPIRFAQLYRTEELGILGFAIMTAPTVRESLLRYIRFQRLVSDSGTLSLEEPDPHISTVRWTRTAPLELGHRLANEIVLGEVLAAMRQLLGTVVPVAVQFRHARPRDIRAHSGFFQAPIRWEQPVDALIVDPGVLDQSPRSANMAMYRHFVHELEQRYAQLGSLSFVQQVERRIEQRLIDGAPSPKQIAHDLGTSERTLRRQLEGEGTSFRELLDAVRRRRAAELLSRADHSVTDVAFALGFSETSAFSRAFRRWFGVPPTARQVLTLAR